jgi:hypothetical protein
MSALRARRIRNFGLVGLSALVLGGMYWRLPVHDWKTAAVFSGWLLFALMVCLVLFNIRKKLPFLPLLSAASWLQFHIYAGSFAAGIFVVHTQYRIPGGAFSRLLWWSFVTLAASGLIGIFLDRLLPARIRNLGEPVLFERIPSFRATLAAEVETLAAKSVRELGTLVIADLYVQRIEPFLTESGFMLSHVLGARRSCARLLRELRAAERYLSPAGRDTLGQIEERVIAKDALDYQYAIHAVLKGWLFIHVPIAFAILPMVGAHIVLFYAFGRV